ncbi:hypothetical protein [Kibdelosporangium phytohabitans]|uniref:Peptidase M23 n=1 Tax=Kibdelosporangium phytohabitans TaxID=860235 RepID=A0A0N9HV55_9PSEU|nr:hypothetical protein AOZ06_01520 [Kibdelosporangium phytohabitans]MBE1466221.1 hypothetical protein [Kibdelosporangium phytohabitans]
MSVLTKAGAMLAGVALVGYLSGLDTDATVAADTACVVPGYTGEQLANAATIVAVGREMGIPQRGWVVAVATAQQESGLRNLSYGDRDSLGLFQQRPSMGWGSPPQVTSPRYAAMKFYERLRGVRGWQQMSVTTAAQAVQRSGFPNAYARHEKTARAIVTAVQGPRCPQA